MGETWSKVVTVSSFIERLTREVFRCHSNPWSAWTHLLSAPLFFVAIWNRSPRGGALLVAWMLANPVVFPEPEDDEAWATRAVLGEEMWIAERPMDRAMALNVGATALGLAGAWGAFRRRLLPTAAGAVGLVALVLARVRPLLRTPPRRSWVTLLNYARANSGELTF